MRRSLLLATLLLGVAFGFLPNGGANADHCGRIFVFTGFSAPANNPTTGQPAGLRPNAGAVGCTSPAAHANTNRITPGSNSTSVRVTQAAKDPIPVSGTITIGTETKDLELKGNADDPSKATQFDSQFLPMDYSKADKIVAKIVFANGTEATVTYTK
jgi:hypothetical protein